MDIRVVETIPTAGSLADTAFAVDPDVENISLDYDFTDKDLSIIDTNTNFNALAFQLGTDIVKKTFLTYNGISSETRQLIQTVVMESDSKKDPQNLQNPGYCNSNEWIYKPSQFRIPGPYPTTSNPLDTSTWPYDQSEGITVVKQFLGGQSGLVENMYTAYYRAPAQHSFQLANAEGVRIYTDGWYTSYVIACKTWSLLQPESNGATKGQIVYYAPQEEFYMNLTGTGGTLVTDPNNPLLLIPDTINWQATPSFLNWMDFLRNNLGTAMASNPVFFTENQHLVTPDLNMSIQSELLKLSNECYKSQFGMSDIDIWMKLTQKRIGAYIRFNDELFKSAQEIIETTRTTCYLCLYHNEFLPTC